MLKHTLLLGCTLLAFATPPAWGTCSWVLWQAHTALPSHKVLHEIALYAYPTYELCMAEASRWAAFDANKSQKEKESAQLGNSGTSVFVTNTHTKLRELFIKYECWPDTVDPRK